MTNPYYSNMPWWGSQNVRGYGSSEFPSWGSENIRGYGDSGGPETDWNQPSNINPNQLNQGLSGATSGLSAGQAFGATENDFQISGGNILGAAGSGAASGFAAGG